jgi:hypothetical protein
MSAIGRSVEGIDSMESHFCHKRWDGASKGEFGAKDDHPIQQMKCSRKRDQFPVDSNIQGEHR